MSAFALPVKGLGTINGVVRKGIAEFLNVKFAHVENRFEYARLVEPVSIDTQRDCTKQGPLCPQKEPFNDHWNGVPIEDCAPLDVKIDEHECLNLRLQIPLAPGSHHELRREKLPVVVWLHGGSNVAGTPYRGSSRADSWIKTAVARGKPFIFIASHYRVGLFGWKPDGDTYNQAVDDQRLVLEWVRKYGPGFGADPSRITLVGQSAGSSDCNAHIRDVRSTCLASQIALLSGHIGTDGFATREEYANLAQRIADHIGCTTEELRTVEWEKIVQAQLDLDIGVYAPIEPEKSLRPSSPADMPRLIVGDCRDDGKFFEDVPELVKATPQGYDTCEFYTDLVFRAGANELWRSQRGVMRQLCDGANPYTPSWGNNHMVELHYIINGYSLENEAITETQKVWADLVSMEEPWDPETQAFQIPFEGLPKIISAEDAWKQRPVNLPPLDSRKYSRLLRGW